MKHFPVPPVPSWFGAIRFIASVCAILLLPRGAHSTAGAVVSPSRIVQATIFSDQAMITREANIRVNKGFNEIHIGVDAFHAIPDSVSARVFGDGELHGVQFRRIPVKDAPQESIRILEQNIQALEYDLQANADRQKMLTNKERFLESVLDFSKTQIPRDIMTVYPGTDDLTKTLGFLGGEFDTLYAQRLALKKTADAVANDIRVLRRELASLTGQRQRETRTIEILFHARKDQTIRIEADYLVRQAFWTPLYKLDVSHDLSGAGLTLFARVRQQTGEDWSDVQLALSNATPVRGVVLPDLTSWRIDIATPPAPVKRLRSQEMAAPPVPEFEAGMTDEVAADAAAAKFVEARGTELPIAFEYVSPRKVSIQSRDKETILPLATRSHKGDFRHFAVPKQNPRVFLTCSIRADKELLPGPMNVHFGPHYVGQTMLTEKQAGETFELNLGVDRGVRIKREKKQDAVRETFFGRIDRSTIIRNMAFQIAIENLKDKDVLVHVLDHVPFPVTDKIRIKDLTITPRPDKTNYKDREGVLLWKIPLKSGESRVIDISFEATYPKDEPVSGL